MKQIDYVEIHEYFNSQIKCLVVMFSSESCKWCSIVQPILEDLEKDYEGFDVAFVKVDYDSLSPDEKVAALIGSLPTIEYHISGEECVASLGTCTKKMYKSVLDNILSGECL